MPPEKDPYEQFLTDEEKADLANFDELVGKFENDEAAEPTSLPPAKADAEEPEAKAEEPEAKADAEEPEAKAEEPEVKAEEPEAEDRPEVEPTFVPTLQGGDIEALDKTLKTIAEERSALTKQYRAGDIDENDFDAKIAALEERRDTAVQERAVAIAERRANETAQAQAFEHDMNGFMRTMSKYEGVDYVGVPLLKNTFLQALAEEGRKSLDAKDNADATTLFERAHSAVLAQFAAVGATLGKGKGAAPKAAAAAPAPAPSAAPAVPKPAVVKPKIPPTLGGLPAAAPSTPAETGFERFANLTGDELERAVARMSSEELNRLERAA